MSFDWEDYLHLAKNLFNTPGNSGLAEASYRSAVSRAYYSVFHHVKLLAIKNGFTLTKSRSVHWDLIDFYRKCNDAKYKNASIKLERLWKNRKECDYENPNTDKNYQSMAQISIQYANDLINWSKNELQKP